MGIKVIWDDEAINFLRRLDKNISSRIVKKIKEIRSNPMRYIFSWVNMDFSKIRIGNYRVFVDFKDDTMIIRTIKHRKNAYKK